MPERYDNIDSDFEKGLPADDTPFEQVLRKYRETAFSERDKGGRFERLMKSFLYAYPLYANRFTAIWQWNEFPSRADFGAGNLEIWGVST
jgi:predicted helicase